MMDKIMTQELGGMIVFETANPPNHPRNKCLGYLLDQIFSDFANINIPLIDMLVAGKHIPNNPKPKTAQTCPSSPETPLYNTSTEQWNWPIHVKGEPQESNLMVFFNTIAHAIWPAIMAQALNSSLKPSE